MAIWGYNMEPKSMDFEVCFVLNLWNTVGILQGGSDRCCDQALKKSTTYKRI